MRLSRPLFWRIVFGLLTLAFVSLTAHSQAFGTSESVLWKFGNSNVDGYGPFAGLIMDTSGNLYGTTFFGGVSSSVGFLNGTVFELTPPSSTVSGKWTESILWNFAGGTADGQNPLAGLMIG